MTAHIEQAPLVRRVFWRLAPTRLFADLISKSWMESVIPFVLFVGIFTYLYIANPAFGTIGNLQSISASFSEFAFPAIAVGLTLISGGIDLSVGAIFALVDFAVLFMIGVWGLPTWLAILLAIALGGVIGAINGFLIGFMKTRPVLTTLVALIIYRSIFNLITLNYSEELAVIYIEDPTWNFIATGRILGAPVSAATLVIFAVVAHVILRNTKLGWRVAAVGSSKKAARHAGINYPLVLFLTYCGAGMVTALGAIFYAARLGSVAGPTGQGLEIQALSAVVVGGISLAGGRGTVARAVLGAAIVFLIQNGLTNIGLPGYFTAGILGFVVILAVGADIRWEKNKGKAIEKTLVNPIVFSFASTPDTSPGSQSPLALNDRLKDAEGLAVGLIEGPEDVVVDRLGRIYTGERQGRIIRFSPPYFNEREVFARIGGRPLGLVFDKDENLIVCVAGMGLFQVDQQGKVEKLTDRTTRNWLSILDNSRLRMADDLDIAPDGKIYFSDATDRFDLHDWTYDSLEGRGNGRLCVYDPATKKTRTISHGLNFANGICLAHDGRSVFVAETWAARVRRYWLEGPKKGKLEVFLDNLAGVPDNINRASDGTYWMAFAGMRSPMYDISMRHPGVRLRMLKQLPRDEWLFPSMNHGCLVKFDESGRILESYWDKKAEKHPMLTSMREHKGYLYLGGLENNRIGRIQLPDADQNWTAHDSYWGKS
ncbi:ABC transporter permease [Metarhizobium album]|uniref:ABC transporter permease n=1 Tax=Metarhizobium album TaxID=2182425 RepID=A0A2U2DUI1_9HYPH|nr:SMP-30/gluconolactonase/LRE family protein [Rhizobium album]PWE56960.1 ABC transporter permease [Rhizobium album]